MRLGLTGWFGVLVMIFGYHFAHTEIPYDTHRPG